MAQIGAGITLGAGVTLVHLVQPVVNDLVLSLDSRDYSGTGTTWPAAVGPDATIYNGVAWTDTGPGYFTFDPASLQFADTPTLGDLSNWTVECWFNITEDLTGYAFPCLITTIYNDGLGNQYGEINYELSPYSVGGNTFSTGYFNGSWTNTTEHVITVGNWYQLVGTFDGTALTAYINGTAFASIPAGGASSANGGPVRIARRWDGDEESQYYMPAKISIAKIYSRALTDLEILQNFNASRSRFGL